MRIDIISVVPQMMESPFSTSILKKAIQKELVSIHFHDLKDYATTKYRSVDDYAYGGGAGMVMQCEPIDTCISKLKSERNYDAVIYMTPDGKTLTQKDCNSYSLLENIIILCGHYKGIDHRLRELHITHEVSVGDYVLSGGETAAIVFCDAIIRLIPKVLNDETSALTDSFQDGLLAPEVYTRPETYKGLSVPKVLLSGNFPKIEEWKHQNALERTQQLRPDLLEES